MNTVKRKYVLNAAARPRRTVPADYAPEGGDGCLTRWQKTRLVLLARRGWERSGSPGGEREFAAWRQAVAERACGLRISRARQRDYGTLRAAYLDAAGDVGAAFETLVRDEDNPRRVAMHHLSKSCAERGLTLSYPAAICRRQYRCGLSEATAAQLWRLVFTVRNRRKK